LADVVREIAGPQGPLEALLEEPKGSAPRVAVVFAHPLPTEGGTMHTKMVFQGAKGLVRSGCAVLRFNFRGVGRSSGEFDSGRGEQEDFRAAVDFMAARYPDLEIWAAGASFGAYVAWAAGAPDDRVCALIAIVPPIDRYDFSAAKSSAKPTFIVAAEEDELIPLKAVREFYAQLQDPKELVVIDRASHLFEGQASEVGDALEELLGDFSCKTQ
jgi:uncharacterized protein